MNSRLPHRSGRQVVSRKLPSDAYETLTSGTSKFIALSAPKAFEEAGPSSQLRTLPHHRIELPNGLFRAASASLLFGAKDKDGILEIAQCSFTLSDIESHSRLTDGEIWEERTFTCWPEKGRRRIAYDRETIIMFPDSEVQIPHMPITKRADLADEILVQISGRTREDYNDVVAGMSHMILELERG